MSYQVIITDTAKEDLRKIAFHIAEQSKSTNIAAKFVRALQNECGKLADFPNAGSSPKDRILKSSGYRYICFKDYLIFYKVDEEKRQVNILAFFNEKMDYMRVMKKYI